MAKTKIEWATDSINIIVGCEKCSDGCKHCYAERMALRLAAMGQEKYKAVTNGKGWNGKLFFDEAALDKLISLKKPRMIFVNSMGDTFHKDASFHWIDQIMDAACFCTQHTFILLTKRADRLLEYYKNLELSEDEFKMLYPNVWAGVTICNQPEADKNIPLLLMTGFAVRFVSIEPMLGKIDLSTIKWVDTTYQGRGQCILHFDARHGNHADSPFNGQKIDWVICGGESGPGARPMHPDWVRSLRDQCKAANVPFLFKQWGEYGPVNGDNMVRMGKKHAGRTLDGVIHDEYPEVRK